MNRARRNTHGTGGSGHSRSKDRRDEVENPLPPVKTRVTRVKNQKVKHGTLIREDGMEVNHKYRLAELIEARMRASGGKLDPTLAADRLQR